MGHYSGSRIRESHPAARIFQRTPTRRKHTGRGNGKATRRQRIPRGAHGSGWRYKNMFCHLARKIGYPRILRGGVGGYTDLLCRSADPCWPVRCHVPGYFHGYPHEDVLLGLPDTIWFPADGLSRLEPGFFSFLLFPVEAPHLFDAVVTDSYGRVLEIQVKHPSPATWIWGAFKFPGTVLHDLYHLWQKRNKADEYVGSLVNAYIALGGLVKAVQAGRSYVDVGTLNGYRQAITLLTSEAGSGQALVRPKENPKKAARR